MRSRSAVRRQIYFQPVHKLRQLLKSRELSAVELTQTFLKYIDELNPILNSIITTSAEQALEAAEAADERLRGNGPAPTRLTGIPIVVKDAISTRGVRTTAGSKMLANYVPPYDATAIERLRRAGAILIAKSNMDEFAMGSSNETSAYGKTHNPWDLERVPGGSSGGSAVAVAVGQAPLALGSDTGGSIRQPAALCGVVGMVPTYGTVSRYGLIAFSSSLEQIGPFARDVRDAAELLHAIAGHDSHDSTTLDVTVPDFSAELGDNADLKNLKLGVVREFMSYEMDSGVSAAFDVALKDLENLGCEIIEVGIPATKNVIPIYYTVAPSEASANLARYDGIRYGFSSRANGTSRGGAVDTRHQGFGEEVKRRIFLGTYALSFAHYDDYYKKAQQMRELVRSEMCDAFEQVDLLVSPTSPNVAFKFGERTTNPLKMYSSDILTLPANIAGLPAISVPCGFADNLPVGLQFIGPHLSDARVLKTAYVYQEATEWHTCHPTLGN